MNLNSDNLIIKDHTKNLIPLDGAFNFRDLGGYVTKDGRTVTKGKIFRADDLYNLSTNDLEYLAKIPMRTYVDFRTLEEIEKAPDLVAKSVKKEVWLPINPGNVRLFKKIDEGKGVEAMEEINRAFVREFQTVYSQFFSILHEFENAPLVFHCSAGKDRTGYAAALFLSALGVDKQSILEDYMISAKFIQKKYAEKIAKYPELEPAYTVNPSYLKAAFDLIAKEYGGMDNYLSHYLKVDFDRLRELYTSKH